MSGYLKFNMLLRITRGEDYSNPGNGVVLLLQTEDRKIIVNIEILQGTIFKLSRTKVLVTLFMN